MSQPRKCNIVEYGRIVASGNFIQYAPVQRTDDGNQPYVITIAIVEADDGRVIEAEISTIRFVD